MRIANIVPHEGYVLFVTAEDGQTGLFDVTPYLGSEVFAPLKDKNEFQRIFNGRYFIAWDCGADLSADTIAARWRKTAPPMAERCD